MFWHLGVLRKRASININKTQKGFSIEGKKSLSNYIFFDKFLDIYLGKFNMTVFKILFQQFM